VAPGPRVVIGWLAWSLAALGLAVATAGRVLELANGERVSSPIAGAFVGVAFLIVGALIASRRPRNPLGWLYLIAMTLIAFGGNGNLADQYAYYSLTTRPGSLPAPDWMIWFGELTLSVGFYGLITFGLLLFPDGRLPSPRWRIVAGAVVVGLLVATAGPQFAPGPMRPAFDVPNPVGLTSVPGLSRAALAASLLVLLVPFLGCVASVFVRFRRATGRERQQLEWFAYGTAWIPAVGVFAVLLSLVAPHQLDSGLGAELWPLSLAGVPIATGIAVLRHRLYDIDLLINRTLVYGALSALLVATYFVFVLAFETVLRPLTGGSEVAVALSTLAVVALFAPLRKRIQAVVDRRFYRSRYDAVRTLDAFSVRLRDEVDLDAVRGELVAAVRDTVQPAHASVWLR
jgi:hypothetical protein